VRGGFGAKHKNACRLLAGALHACDHQGSLKGKQNKGGMRKDKGHKENRSVAGAKRKGKSRVGL